MRLNVLFCICAACAWAGPAAASWYWPFDREADTNAPPRLHRLLVKANDYIELAEDESLNGEAEKAIAYYRQALDELDRVERENPERADLPEFAPLRNKRATCAAAIDAIRFAQVEENERAVAVTDTRELQKKWRAKKGLATPEDRAADAQTDEPAPPPDEMDTPRAAPPKKPAAKKPAAPKKTAPALSPYQRKFQAALADVRQGDFVAADLALEDLLKERPSDLSTLLLRAAAQEGLGSHYAARRTLETAMRLHPKSYLPYYNLAHLALTLGEGVESARAYYDLGRTVGGPANAALEKKLKAAAAPAERKQP